MILVTGGAGFIGANFVLDLAGSPGYGGRRQPRQADLRRQPAEPRGDRYGTTRGTSFVHAATSATATLVRNAARASTGPTAVMHFAAESHVDRSIDGAPTSSDQRRRHVQPARGRAAHWERLDAGRRAAFRFLHVSTDEVFGSLGETGLQRGTPYSPRSPVLGVEGGVGPPGARLPAHARPADADHQLLEQLRAVPVSGEADPAAPSATTGATSGAIGSCSISRGATSPCATSRR
jgi:dTDP-glucose 4,6-dehydratase